MRGRGAGKRRARASRLALFVEGSLYSNLRGREELSALWATLCRVCGVAGPELVVGFSKGQLRKMDPRADVVDSGIQALDLLVAQHHDLEPFDRAVIAFDAFPTNQQVIPKGCQHKEIDFLLSHFEASARLPAMLRDAAKALRQHYATPLARRLHRAPGALEVLYMWPSFEGLLVSDEPTAKRALVGQGLATPSQWPKFDASGLRPDQSTLPRAVECANKEARTKVRGPFSSNKHGWAEYIVRHAQPGCRMLSHPIAIRLSFVARR